MLRYAHTHIPKTAGTYFNYLLASAYGSGFVQIPESWEAEEIDRVPSFGNAVSADCLRSMTSNNTAIEVCSSHYLMPTDELLTEFPSLKFIAFIRNPKERLVSDYSHKCELVNGAPDLEQWLSKRHNLQVAMLDQHADVQNILNKVRSGRLVIFRTEEVESALLELFGIDIKTTKSSYITAPRNENRGANYKQYAISAIGGLDTRKFLDKEFELYHSLASVQQGITLNAGLPLWPRALLNQYASKLQSFRVRKNKSEQPDCC